jgi:hypothetical protein
LPIQKGEINYWILTKAKHTSVAFLVIVLAVFVSNALKKNLTAVVENFLWDVLEKCKLMELKIDVFLHREINLSIFSDHAEYRRRQKITKGWHMKMYYELNARTIQFKNALNFE